MASTDIVEKKGCGSKRCLYLSCVCHSPCFHPPPHLDFAQVTRSTMAEGPPVIPTFKLVLGKRPNGNPSEHVVAWRHGSAHLLRSCAVLHSSRAHLAPRSLYVLFTLLLTRVCSRRRWHRQDNLRQGAALFSPREALKHLMRCRNTRAHGI